MVKVSIIIPVYNVALYVEQCIRTVLAQTYKNIEIIVVDDCGNDNSIELVKKMSDDNVANIHIIRNPRNMGLSESRNVGIRYATGDFLFFLDSDDYISDDCIESLVHVYEKFPKSQIVVGETQSFPSYCAYLSKKKRYPEYMNCHRVIKKSLLRSNDIMPMVTNVLYKADFMKQHNLRFKEGLVHEDFHFIFYLAKYVHNMSMSRNVTYYYRTNNTGGIIQEE